MHRTRRGFTLIELVIVIAIIAIMAGVAFVTSNPAGQLAASRNNERLLQLQTMMNAIQQNRADQGNEYFSCAAGAVPTTSEKMASASGSYNIGPCLVPVYIAALPFDPSASSAYYLSANNFNTGYDISINASGTITLTAPYAELGKSIHYP